MAPTTRDRFVDEVVADVGLGADDRARLAALDAQLAPHGVEITARLFEQLRPRHSAERVAALTAWMTTGLRGPRDDEQLARQLVAAGLPQHHLVTAIRLLRGEYHERIDQLYAPLEARRVSRSVDKLLDVELAVILRHYQLDCEAKLAARERSAQSDRVAAIQTLSAGLAHEIRNPLNSAKLQLELLDRRLRRGAEDRKLLEPVDQVNHELARLTRMLNEFLAFASPSQLLLETHDLVAVAREVVAAARAEAERRGAALELDGAGPLPAVVDRQKVQQILQNLIHNAVEAITAGGRVTITIAGDADQVHLAIEDDGPGIPEAVQRRIYEPFFTTKDSCTGLGLSIVHGMVSLHGGTVSLDSSPRGTRFHVTLPRRGC
jgi:signal transduction histidine kinase